MHIEKYELTKKNKYNVYLSNGEVITLDERTITGEEYTVTYDANGGTGAPNTQTTNYGMPLYISNEDNKLQLTSGKPLDTQTRPFESMGHNNIISR